MSTVRHARLGPSNHRWPHCPGSVREEERYPDIPGEAAIDGTGSHILLELCLNNCVPAIEYDMQIIGVNHVDNPQGWLVDLDRCNRVQMALDYIVRRSNELKDLHPGCAVVVQAETKSDPGGAFGRKDWWGTCDITITARHPMTGAVYFIEVIDYKDGRMYVSEKDNTQLIAYLFGKLRLYVASGPELVRPFVASKVPNCRMTIIQPKTTPAIRYQCSLRSDDGISTASVIQRAHELDLAADKTDDPNAPLIDGPHCRWCKANPKRGGNCTAAITNSMTTVTDMSNTELTLSVDQDLFTQMTTAIANVKSLTVEQLSKMADAEPGFMQAFKAVKDEIELRIDQGDHVPGYAKQPGNDSQVWSSDEAEIVKMLKARRLKKDDIYPSKLISPAAVLKLDSLTAEQKAKIQRDYIVKKAGKKTLQRVSHDHQAKIEKVIDAELMFADVPKPEVSFF